MGDSYLETYNILRSAFRLLFATLDRPFYWLLGLVYELFFNVASADLFSNATVMKFYGRVQIILGVFMMFHLAMTILRGIMNPDSFVDAKSGAGNLITRVITALLLLTALMPIGISSPRNEYEVQISNNGLLFGTLYSLQHRLLANNTLGRLVLGVDSSGPNYLSASSKKEELETSARIFTSTVLKGFYRINLLPESERKKHEDGKDDAIFNENRVCQDIDDSVLAAYTRVDADPGEIISLVNETCDTNSVVNKIPVVKYFAGSKMYVFAYMPIVSTIVAIVFVFILLSFTIDVAVRAIKLAVLRLIAPIPIISYMDPKGSKDSAFNSWVKTLTSTYLDLFIRLASVYFVIYLIEDIIKNGLYINNASGVLGALSFIAICIGLFVFAKQAPKFIKDVLGLKNEPGKLFGGIQEALSVGAVGVGAVGGAIARHQSGGSAIAGFIGGGYNAGKALWNSKDYDSKAVMNQVRAYNAKTYSNAADESTPWGRFAAGMQANFGFRNALQNYDDKIKYYGAATDAWKQMNTAFNSDTAGVYTAGADLVTSGGETLLDHTRTYSTKQLNDLYDRMTKSGRYSQAELDAVDAAKKAAQQQRFAQIVNATNVANNGASLTGTAAQIFQNARTIHTVGTKYSEDRDGVFAVYHGVSFADMATAIASTSADFATNVKGAAFNAERQANVVKSSPEYAQAKANAQRAAENQKK